MIHSSDLRNVHDDVKNHDNLRDRSRSVRTIFFSLMRNDVAALRLATCVFPLEKKESSLSFEPFFKDISFKSLFFLHQHGC